MESPNFGYYLGGATDEWTLKDCASGSLLFVRHVCSNEAKAAAKAHDARRTDLLLRSIESSRGF